MGTPDVRRKELTRPIVDGRDDTGASERGPRPLPTVVFRTVTALRVTVVPANRIRSHVRGVVGEKGNGRVKLLKGDGEEEEFDWDGEGSDVGSDVIVIAQRGPRGGPNQVSATSTPDVITERLERLQEKLSEKQAALAEKLAEMQQTHEEKRIERLERTKGNAPQAVQDKIDEHLERARGRPDDAGQGGGSDDAGPGGGSDDAGQGGGSDDAGQGGGSDNSNQGGGKGRDK